VKLSRRAQVALRYAAVAAAGFLLAFVVVAFAIFPNDTSVREVKVPALVGLSLDEARRRLAGAGLKLSLGDSVAGGDRRATSVVAQTPAAGARIFTGGSVTLDVTASQEPSSVPELSGMVRTDAISALQNAGLISGHVTEETSERPRGIVLRTQPVAGQLVPRGTPVDFVVSGGPPMITMPDLTGHDFEDARGIVEQLGLRLAAAVEYDSLSVLPNGSVLAHFPPFGARVTAGDSVILRVAGKP
jgi:eukaryotic-like serine/threonine-protein kinase